MRALAVLALASILAGCSTPLKPVNVSLGEACTRCKQPISNERIAAEQVSPNGWASKFRTVHCMTTWIAQQPTAPKGWMYVANYDRGGWIRADRASYVRVVINPNTLEKDFIAFTDPRRAAEAARVNQSEVVSWQAVLDLGRSQPIGGN